MGIRKKPLGKQQGPNITYHLRRASDRDRNTDLFLNLHQNYSITLPRDARIMILGNHFFILSVLATKASAIDLY